MSPRRATSAKPRGEARLLSVRAEQSAELGRPKAEQGDGRTASHLAALGAGVEVTPYGWAGHGVLDGRPWTIEVYRSQAAALTRQVELGDARRRRGRPAVDDAARPRSVWLTSAEHARLRAVCERRGVTAGDVMRAGIKAMEARMVPGRAKTRRGVGYE